MIRRVVLENYMSHSRTELDLADGLTALVGPNNCGKSAVVEAIRTVCENSGKDFMVRHGEKVCRVLIETDDGHTIEWKRDKSVVSYTIDGRDVHRLGGGVPDDLHELLRLPHVISPDGKDEFEIHIALQKSPLFLLERSGREAAMFFASSSDAALVMDMQRRHKQRVTERKRDEAQLAKQQLQYKARLDCLAPVTQVDEKLRAAEDIHEQIRNGDAVAERLAAEANVLQEQLERVRLAKDRFAALAPLPAPPALDDTRLPEKLLGDMALAKNAVMRAQEMSAHLTALTEPPVLADAASLEITCRQLRDRAIEVLIGQSRSTVMQKLGKPPMLTETMNLSALCRDIDRQLLNYSLCAGMGLLAD